MPKISNPAKDVFTKTISIRIDAFTFDKAKLLSQKYGSFLSKLLLNILTAGVDTAINNPTYFQVIYLANKIKRTVFKIDSTIVSTTPLSITPELLDKIDILVSLWKTNRHDVMCQLITIGVDEMNTFDRLGLLKAGLAVIDIQEGFKRISERGSVITHSIESNENDLTRITYGR